MNEYLETNDLKIIFYPHIEAQKFIHCFTTKSNRVTIATPFDYVVEDLLLNTKMLITDYSSVFFDFALLKKKVVYFQFDREDEFRSRPWGEHFLYERDGFGPVFFLKETMIDYLVSQKDLTLEKQYEERIERIFPVFDDNNCQRVFNAIIEL